MRLGAGQPAHKLQHFYRCPHVWFAPAPAPARAFPPGCPCVRVPPISVAIAAAAAAAVLLWTIARTVAASDFRFRLVVPPWSCLFGFYLPRSCLHKWAKLAFSPPWPHS